LVLVHIVADQLLRQRGAARSDSQCRGVEEVRPHPPRERASHDVELVGLLIGTLILGLERNDHRSTIGHVNLLVFATPGVGLEVDPLEYLLPRAYDCASLRLPGDQPRRPPAGIKPPLHAALFPQGGDVVSIAPAFNTSGKCVRHLSVTATLETNE